MSSKKYSNKFRKGENKNFSNNDNYGNGKHMSKRYCEEKVSRNNYRQSLKREWL